MLEPNLKKKKLKPKVIEKWSSVRLSNDSKNRTIIENHISTTPNVNLNGLSSGSDSKKRSTKNLGQEVTVNCVIYQTTMY